MGTRPCTHQTPYQCQDHPHAYGDKLLYTLSVLVVVGSSPRVWGQETVNSKVAPVDRIIPTRMGTSSPRITAMCLTRDHPHAYGDKLLFKRVTTPRAGSSPRVWGQEAFDGLFAKRERIIPTRMGTSLLATLGQQIL